MIVRLEATICVPYYDAPAYVEQTIDSALAQTAHLREVLVIDDGSSDRVARDLVARRAKEGAPIRYVRVTNRGLPNARNVGLLLAEGEFFVPLDSDDWIEPDFLAQTVPLMADERVGAVLTGLQEHGPLENGSYGPAFQMALAEVDEQVQWRQNQLWYCALFRRAALVEAGGWNGRMVDGLEDWDLWIDLLRRGWRLAGVEDRLFNYRKQPNSMLRTMSEALRAEIVIEMRRHHGVQVV